jgi:hypothetical protein
MKTKEKISREKEIKKEITRLNKIFKEISTSKKAIALGLIHEAAFMRTTLSGLKEVINKNGVIEVMPQGDYEISIVSPEVKTYNTMIQRYTAVCKELNNLLPPDVPKINDDGFDEFVINK